MIHEKIEKLVEFIPVEKQDKVKKFLDKVSADMEETRYPIEGEDIYARVMSYNTKLEENCDIEAHDCYVDIQFTLVGEEGISIYPREKMELVSNDEEKDFITFKKEDVIPAIKVRNEVGWFTLIHTYEAHRPQESTNRKCEVVKKCVIKIKEKCYE